MIVQELEGNMCNICLGKLSKITKDLSEVSQCHEKGSGSKTSQIRNPSAQMYVVHDHVPAHSVCVVL
jgi:hypothetical protein